MSACPQCGISPKFYAKLVTYLKRKAYTWHGSHTGDPHLRSDKPQECDYQECRADTKLLKELKEMTR